MRRYKPSRLIIFSRDELKQFEMAQVFPFEKYDCIRFFIGDVMLRGGRPVSNEFEYNSGTNPWQMTIEKMSQVISAEFPSGHAPTKGGSQK